MPSPSTVVPIVRDCARSCVNPALPAETDAPSRTAADSRTALLPPYPRAVRELPVWVPTFCRPPVPSTWCGPTPPDVGPAMMQKDVYFGRNHSIIRPLSGEGNFLDM